MSRGASISRLPVLVSNLDRFVDLGNAVVVQMPVNRWSGKPFQFIEQLTERRSGEVCVQC